MQGRLYFWGAILEDVTEQKPFLVMHASKPRCPDYEGCLDYEGVLIMEGVLISVCLIMEGVLISGCLQYPVVLTLNPDSALSEYPSA